MRTFLVLFYEEFAINQPTDEKSKLYYYKIYYTYHLSTYA